MHQLLYFSLQLKSELSDLIIIHMMLYNDVAICCAKLLKIRKY